MSVSRRRNLAAIMAATAGVGLGISTGDAATFTWDQNSGVDNNWNTANNWTADSGTPGAADVAQWSGGSTPSPSTVDLSQNEAAANLFVNSKVVTFNLNNFTLAVGSTQTNVQGTTGQAIFNGNGSMTMSGDLRIGFIGNNGHSQVTAQGGADVTTTGGISIGDYQNGGRVLVDGAGSTWTSTGPVQFARGGSPYVTFGQTHRAELVVTNGGVFTHTLANGPASSGNQWTMAPGGPAAQKNSRIAVDGAGSQFNLLGSYNGNIRIGGYSGNVTFDVTNGGTWAAPNLDMPLAFAGGTGVTTVNISGSNATMTANTFALAGRTSSDMARNGTVVNVGVGGLFQATGFDGGDRGIAVGDKGRISLQGGTVDVPAGKTVNLRDGGLADRSTLEGFGNITGGSLVAEADSQILPGDVNGVAGAGTIALANGGLTTAGTGNGVLLNWDLSTDPGNAHDLIAAASPSSVVTIGDNSTSAIDYSVLGGGTLASGGTGFMDFLIGGTVNYGGTALGADVPNIDDLDDLMAAAGYSRVSVTPGAGEYRYFLTLVGAGDYEGGAYVGQQALRLELAPIPEPTSMALLGLGMLPLLRRRRSH